MSRNDLDVVRASKEVRGLFNLYQSIEWKNDTFYIQLTRDIETGDIELFLLTSLYNNDFLEFQKDVFGKQQGTERNSMDLKITTDTMIDKNMRYVGVESYNLNNDFEGTFSYVFMSCSKNNDYYIDFILSVVLVQRHYIYATKGNLMLVKMDSGEILELKNLYDVKSEAGELGESIALSYLITEEQIKKFSSGKIVKMRLAVGLKNIDVDVSGCDLSRYIVSAYSIINERIIESPSIYDGF